MRAEQLAYVVASGDEPELERRLFKPAQRESREPVVPLDVAEHRLDVDAPLLSELRALFRMEQRARPLLELGQARVHLNSFAGVLVFRLEARLPQRASATIGAFLYARRALEPPVRLRLPLPGEGELSPVGAGVGVRRLVVVPVGAAHLVFAPFPVPAFPEEFAVLDVGVHALALALEVRVRLLAAVSRVGDDAARQTPEAGFGVLAMVDRARGFVRLPVERRVDDELVLRVDQAGLLRREPSSSSFSSSIADRWACTLARSAAWYLSVDFFQTKENLFALASIFVPSRK